MLGVIDQLLVLMILRRVSEYLRLDHNRATTSGHLVCALMRLILQRLLKLSNHNMALAVLALAALRVFSTVLLLLSCEPSVVVQLSHHRFQVLFVEVDRCVTAWCHHPPNIVDMSPRHNSKPLGHLIERKPHKHGVGVD